MEKLKQSCKEVEVLGSVLTLFKYGSLFTIKKKRKCSSISKMENSPSEKDFSFSYKKKEYHINIKDKNVTNSAIFAVKRGQFFEMWKKR